jgi:DNA-binding NarL/FixJ family response regulator
VPEGSILYRAMTRPLVDEAAEVRALVAKHQVDLVICDSLGPACGADPETAGAATGALTALRSLAPASRLVIAHVSKAEADRQYGTARPFGSVYVYNLARSVVEARRNDSPDQGEFTCTFTHTKSNTGPRQGQTAVRWVFSEEGYILARKGEPDMARAPLRMQIKDALRAGKKTVQELAEELHRSETEIRVRLNEMEKRTEVVRLTVHQGGRANKVPWGLAEQSVQVPEW